MAIQMRRGAYGDFDPTRMLPGEWAVVLEDDTDTPDGYAVYICYAAGTVKRIVSSDELASLVDNIYADVEDYVDEAFDVDAIMQAATDARSAALEAQSAIEAIGDISELAVPLMSASTRGGAKLGSGLVVEDGALSVDASTIEVPIATTSNPGVVMPDGTTITVDSDGTIHGTGSSDLPTMSATTKGGAKLGAGLSISSDTLSLAGESYTSAEKTKLAGIEANANNYVLPTMDASTKGGAKLGDGLSIANDVLSVDASDVADGQLPIAHGGTGAATAAAALANLGAAAVDSDGFVTVAGEPSYPLFIWDSTHVSPEDYSGTYPISPCFVYYIPNKGLYYCTDN